MALTQGTIWITGLSASGKTTLGEYLRCNLQKKGIENVKLLDGEELRKNFDRIYGHSLEERYAVVSKIIKIAHECNQKGSISIVCTISHKKEMREMARQEIRHFMEVYLKCPVEVCARRDYKGNYKKAFQGEGEYFAGITEPYEKSENPELVLDTASKSINECSAILLNRVLEFLEDRFPLVLSTSAYLWKTIKSGE